MTTLRDEFISWQCRVRKEVVRARGGRPSEGMQPLASRQDGTELLPITVLLIERAPAASTQAFRHIVRQTPDPKQRLERGLKLLGAEFYHDPSRFADTLAAVFAGSSSVATQLARDRRCVLDFKQGARAYRLVCTVRELDAADPVFQASFWHNHLFNPHPPADARVMSFSPQWSEATSTNRA